MADSDKRGSAAGVLAYSTLFVGTSQFVPLPFVDAILERRVRKSMVQTLLKRHARSYGVGELGLLYGSGRGCVMGCLVALVSFPIKLIVEPIKKLFKTVFFVLTIRDAGLVMGDCFLLGRTLDRLLARGELGDELAAKQRHARVRQVRAAFDETYAGSDLSLLRHLFEQTLRGAKALPAAGAKAARALMKGDSPSEPAQIGELDASERAVVDEGEAQLEQALADEKVQGFLADFDQRFDAALAKLG